MIEIRDYTDDELRAIEPITLDPGELGADGTRRGRTLRNPFTPDGKPVADEPRATLANRWSSLHWPSKSAGPAVAETSADPMDVLMERLDVIDGKTKKLWYASNENPAYKDAEGAALFPIVRSFAPDSPARRALEDEWEQRSIEMHRDQVAVVLDPLSPDGFRYVQPNTDDAPMRYEDYVKQVETERRQKAEAKPKDDDDEKDGEGKPKLTRGD